MKIKALTLFVGLALYLPSYAQTTNNTKIDFFQGNFEEALKEAKKTKKHLLLDFWATWCKSCKKLDSETFADENVYSLINKNYIVYRVDIDYFEGMDMADKFQVDAFPTLVMLNHRGKYLYRLKGFYPANYLLNELKRPIKTIVMNEKKITSY